MQQHLKGENIAMANTILSRTHFRKGDVDEAYKVCSGALLLARQSEDHSIIATVLEWMSNLLQHRGNLGQAWTHTIEAQGHAQAAGDLKMEYRCMMNRTVYCMKAGNFRRACALYADLDPFAKRVGMEKGVDAISVMNLKALIHGRKSEFDDARDITATVVEMTRGQKTMRLMHLMVSVHLAYYDAAIGTTVDPDSIHARAVQFPPDRWRSYCDRTLAFIFERRGELQESCDLLLKCLTVARGKYSEEVNACFRSLGDNMYSRAEISSAAHYFVLHLVMSHNIEDYEGIHQALRRIGDIFLADGDKETAESLFTLALEGFTQMDIHKARGETMLRLGDLSMARGDVLEAKDLWEQARQLFIRSSQREEVDRCDERLESEITLSLNPSHTKERHDRNLLVTGRYCVANQGG